MTDLFDQEIEPGDVILLLKSYVSTVICARMTKTSFYYLREKTKWDRSINGWNRFIGEARFPKYGQVINVTKLGKQIDVSQKLMDYYKANYTKKESL